MKSIVYATLAALTLGFTLSASARDVVLPAGTLLQCTLNEPNFSTATGGSRRPVLCHLRGVTEFGQQAFPRGSYLVGHLESSKEPGHFFGKGNMKLQFDRIGLPSGDLPLDAKLVATRGYKVDKEGDIRGRGTPSATWSNGCFRPCGLEGNYAAGARSEAGSQGGVGVDSATNG